MQLSANAYSILVEPFISTRDYVTFDQRGTGLSEPVMNCDELDKVHRQDPELWLSNQENWSTKTPSSRAADCYKPKAVT